MVALSVQIEVSDGLSWARWKRIVSEVERLGYRGLYCCDHFPSKERKNSDAVGIITALTYLAGHSSSLEFGPLVAPVSFRDPVMLVRQAMSLDDLSGGRMILGVGAGHVEREHVEFGSRVAMQNSHATTDAELNPLREVPHWTWAGDD